MNSKTGFGVHVLYITHRFAIAASSNLESSLITTFNSSSNGISACNNAATTFCLSFESLAYTVRFYMASKANYICTTCIIRALSHQSSEVLLLCNYPRARFMPLFPSGQSYTRPWVYKSGQCPCIHNNRTLHCSVMWQVFPPSCGQYKRNHNSTLIPYQLWGCKIEWTLNLCNSLLFFCWGLALATLGFGQGM